MHPFVVALALEQALVEAYASSLQEGGDELLKPGHILRLQICSISSEVSGCLRSADELVELWTPVSGGDVDGLAVGCAERLQDLVGQLCKVIDHLEGGRVVDVEFSGLPTLQKLRQGEILELFHRFRCYGLDPAGAGAL